MSDLEKSEEEKEQRGNTIVVKTGSKSSGILMWIVAMVAGILIGSMFSDKIPFIGNKEVKKLEKVNKELLIRIENRNENVLVLRREVDTLKVKNNNLELVVVNRDSTIQEMTVEIDSISQMVTQQDSIIIKIYDEKYKDINGVRSMDINERIGFFSDFFKSRAKGN